MPPRTRPWINLIHLYCGSRQELAQALGLTRQGLLFFCQGRHRVAPWRLCKRLSELLLDGTIDGSPPPTAQELVRSWRVAFPAKTAGAP